MALTFRATVDQPQRFARSKAVGAHFGLTPRRFQSGETDYDGRTSKCGDDADRTLRGGAGAPHTHPEMVLAQGSGYAGRPSPRRQEGDRCLGPAPCRHLHRIWIDDSEFIGAKKSIPRQPEKGLLSLPGGRVPLAGTMGEASSQRTRFRFGRTMFRLFHLTLLNPSCGGLAPTSERSESLARQHAFIGRA